MRRVAVLAALALFAVSGCLASSASLHAECGQRVLPTDLPRGAPRSGGDGDVALRVKVLDDTNASIARTAVLAWWIGDDGRVAYVALRTGGDGVATVHVPRGASVRVWGGSLDWTGDETVVAGEPLRLRYPGADPGTLELPANAYDGFFSDFWVQLPPAIGLPLGPTHVWMPNDLPWAQADRLARLESVEFRLAWVNNMDGIVDLGIGVGRAEAWESWNQAVQAEQGIFQETLVLTRADLESRGWTSGEGLQAGPSLGTWGATTDKLTWDLRYTAHFAQDPSRGDLCAAGGLAPHDVT